jgi:Ca-activated chloride channel family protein
MQAIHRVAQMADTQTLEGVTATGRVSGLFFELTVEQRYRNATGRNIEAVYSFPLPWGAELMSLEFDLGGRTLAGTVVPRKVGEERYEGAIDAGDTAVLLERAANGIYTANVGNLMPGESAVVRYRYAQLLRLEKGHVRLTVPTVIAPRYGDAESQAGLAPHQVPASSLLVDYPFEIAIAIDGPLASGAVSSPSHAVAVTRTEDGIELRLARSSQLDRDFVVEIGALKGRAFGSLCRDADGWVALASFCPTFPKSGTRPARTAKILVDCSGSMNGSSIEAARRALHAILSELEFEDRFSLSRFGSRVEHLDEGLQPVTDETIARAGKAVMDLRADLGGTELAAALASTLARDKGERADVLLITDGQSWNAEGIVKTAQASGQRVFVVGIGAASAESLLRKLAEKTGGACEFVVAGEAAERAITRMFSRMTQVPARGARLSWPCVPEWEVPVGSSIFEGETVHAFARFPEAPSGPVQLAFSLVGAGEVLAEVDLGRPIQAATDLPRMAAARLLGLVDREERLQLALRYQLITEQTNCVLVHERADGEKATQLPQLKKVEQMLAAGWGGMGRADLPVSYENLCVNDMEPPRRAELEPLAHFSRRRESVRASDDSFIATPRGPASLVQNLNTSFMDTLLGRTTAPCSFSHLESLNVPDPIIERLRKLVGGQDEERYIVAMFLLLMVEAVAPEGGKRHVKRELRGVLRGHPDPKALRHLLEVTLGPIDPSSW